MAAIVWWTADNIKYSRGWIITTGPWIDLGLPQEGTVHYPNGGPVAITMSWKWKADRALTATLLAVDIPGYGTSILRLDVPGTMNRGDILDVKWTTEG